MCSDVEHIDTADVPIILLLLFYLFFFGFALRYAELIFKKYKDENTNIKKKLRCYLRLLFYL